jgi:hypothetical protein
MPAPDSAMVRIINPASRMPRPAAIFLGDADAEPAVLRERGDEGLLLLAQTEIHSRTTLVLFPRA